MLAEQTNTTTNHHPQRESNNMEYTSPLTYYSVVHTSWDTHVQTTVVQTRASQHPTATGNKRKAHINIKQTTCQHILSSNNTKCNSAIGLHKRSRSVWFVAVVVCVCTLFVLRPNEKQNTVVRAGGTPTPQTTTTHNLNQTTWNTHHHLHTTRWYKPVGTHMCKQQ